MKYVLDKIRILYLVFLFSFFLHFISFTSRKEKYVKQFFHSNLKDRRKNSSFYNQVPCCISDSINKYQFHAWHFFYISIYGETPIPDYNTRFYESSNCFARLLWSRDFFSTPREKHVEEKEANQTFWDVASSQRRRL